MTEPTTPSAAVCRAAAGSDLTSRVRILGPVRAERGTGDLAVGGPQQQLVLVLLLAQAGQLVRADELVWSLWGADPPPSAYNVLHRHVGNIRRLFEPDLPPRAEGSHLHRRAGGYRILIGDEDLDLLRFRRYAREASMLTDPAAAVGKYLQALVMWKGPVASGLPGTPENPVISGIEAEKVAVLLEAADCAVSAGQAPRLITFLRAAAWQHPLDERLHARYLLCLAESGCRAEAIQGWRRLQRRLQEDLGVEPSEELLALRERLWEPSSAATAPPRLRVVPDRPVADSAVSFVPRRTAVAVRLALAHDEGRLHVSMRGVSPFADPAQTLDVLARFFESWGIPASDPAVELIPSTGPYDSVLVQQRPILRARRKAEPLPTDDAPIMQSTPTAGANP